MNKQPLQTRVAKLLALAFGLSCIIAFCQTRANADTINITGDSDTQNPLLSSFAGIGFIGQTFNNNFIVTANGQTFDFVFGQYSIPAAVGEGESGCTDGPCLPIALTGNLTSPVGPLSFGGFMEEAEGIQTHSLIVDWTTGSGPFAFTTVEGGSGTFNIELVDFLAVNGTASTQLYNQMARITITSFTPGAAAAVPEPATMLMLGSGLAGLIISKRRRRRFDV